MTSPEKPPPTEPARSAGLAASVLALLEEAGATLAVAESLTGGLLAATLVQVPGASAVFRGGMVTYATDLKSSLLGVDAGLLEAGGPVQAQVALQMADGVLAALGADVGLATTGVAGPGPADGHEAGTVFVAVGGRWGSHVLQLHLCGDRAAVRAGSVEAVLRLLARAAVPAGAGR